MTAKNLGSKNVNTDDTTSVYGVAGNAIEVIGPVSVTVFADPLDAAGEGSIPIWYAPATSDQYFTNLLNSPQDFATVAGGIAVFKMYEIMASWPDATLKAFFSYLTAHNIKLGIDALPLVASKGQPGYGTEAFGEPGTLVSLVGRIKALGGTLSYVAWDEPWCYGVATGLFTVSQVASQVALATSEVKAIFPAAQIGDIEPVGAAASEAPALKAWFNAYAQASGAHFDFFQADVATWSYGWQTGLAANIAMVHAYGIPFGAIIDGDGLANSNASWSAAAVANAQLMLSDPALRPDYLIVQSWQSYPSEIADPAVAGTLASVEADVTAGEKAALAVPALAQYDTSGVLQSVTWQGGWSAIQDGTILEFLSPTGTVVSKALWVNVQLFAFDPSTATLSLRMLKQSSTPGGTLPIWNVQSFSVSAGTGGFVFGVPTTATGALTMVLAPSSQTGLAGSNFTNQALPTLTGTGTPGAVVTLQVDGNALGQVTASSAGVWAFTFKTKLTTGEHVVQATMPSATAGGTVAQLYAVSVDTTQPAPPTLTLAPGSDSGYGGDDVTDVTQPVFTGVAAPHTLINLFVDLKLVAAVETDQNGVWSYDPGTALALGAHSVTATATNIAGSVSVAASMHLVIDTAAAEAANTSPDPLFDTEWYDLTYPAAAAAAVAAGESAYTQFMTSGWKQGNDPDPFFSTSYYLSTYADVAKAGFNPLTHFEQSGWKEGRNINATLNTHDYIKANPGIPAGEDPITFYIQNLQYSDAVYTAVRSTSVTVALLHDTGVSATDGVTSDPTLAIAAAPGATVTVAVGSASPSVFTLGASGSWSYAYAPADPADGKYDVTVTETELNGPTSVATLDFTLDRTPPTVTAVTAPASGIALGAGSVVTVTVTFSEAVLVTGAPTLTFNDGGVGRYVSGSGGDALAFAYTVLAGQNTTALAVSAVNLPGGAAIVDAAGNAANVAGAATTLPGPLKVTAPSSGAAAAATLTSGQSVSIGGDVNGASVALEGESAATAAAIHATSAVFGAGSAVQVVGNGTAARYGSLIATGTTTNDGAISAWPGASGGAATLAVSLTGSSDALDNCGTIDAEAGSTIRITGGTLVNSGTLVANGMMFLGPAVSGTGAIVVGGAEATAGAAGDAGSVEIAGAIAAGQSIRFDSGTVTIDLMSGFRASVTNFGHLDQLVLKGLDVTSVSFADGVLELNGGAAGSLHLAMTDPAADTFVLTHSGGSTTITTITQA